MSRLSKAFNQEREFYKARELAYGLLNCNGRHTITGLIGAIGKQFTDWSSFYRLFQEEGRMDVNEIFSIITDILLENELSEKETIYAHMDDTLLHKKGKKVNGTAWRRDPLGPPFHTNFIWGQRFLQLSIALSQSSVNSPSRSIPVDIQHCPTAKKPKKNDSKDKWEAYKKRKERTKLSFQGVQRIKALRVSLDEKGAEEKTLVVSVDGSYTNRTVLKQIPERTVIIGRIRKDSRIYALPEESNSNRGRRKIYGQLLQTPEKMRKDDKIPWQEVRAFAAGKSHLFNVKIIKNVRWRASGENIVQLIIIRPLAYKLTKKSRLLYRKPAYLICTDPNLGIEELLQAYLWRWEIEVNFKEEKSLLGVGEAQVRKAKSVEKVPAFFVAVYSLLLIAAHRTAKFTSANQLPRPKWYPREKSNRTTTGDIINVLRAQLYSRAIDVNFLHFVNSNYRYAKSVFSNNPLLSAAFFMRN